MADPKFLKLMQSAARVFGPVTEPKTFTIRYPDRSEPKDYIRKKFFAGEVEFRFEGPSKSEFVSETDPFFYTIYLQDRNLDSHSISTGIDFGKVDMIEAIKESAGNEWSFEYDPYESYDKYCEVCIRLGHRPYVEHGRDHDIRVVWAPCDGYQCFAGVLTYLYAITEDRANIARLDEYMRKLTDRFVGGRYDN